MKEVIVVIGSGAIAQAIARRVGVGKHILLADIKSENTQKLKTSCPAPVSRSVQRLSILLPENPYRI